MHAMTNAFHNYFLEPLFSQKNSSSKMDHAIMMAHYLRAHTRYTKNIAKEEEEDIPNTL